jgi:radical SAM superfamily enzyme YgiQ (UPF0313 family)
VKITLVQNFLLDSSGAATGKHLYPHLGLISLIAEIRRSAHAAELYDPMLQLDRGELKLDDSIYSSVAAQLLLTEPDVVGFTALGCNFLAVLKIASAVRRWNPNIIILLGGPHATVLENEIMERFPEFDVIVRGEAEHTIVPLLNSIEYGNDLSEMAGISFRRGANVFRSRAEAPSVDVNELLFPAFDIYPIAELGMRGMRVEAGRGCPFQCSFCSTATFFGRKYRVKDATKLVRELKVLHTTYNIADFALQHDLFTVNRRKVLEFCEEVRQCGFSWTCSARIDCVDSALLTEMAAAGCRGIYFGVETGSAFLQELVKKRLDLTLLGPVLKHTRDIGINATTSFITGFPKERADDLEATLSCMESCIRMTPETSQVQLHLLTPEPGTALYGTYKSALLFDGHISDFNFPPLEADEPLLLEKIPEVFMTHHYYPTELSREVLIAITTAFPYLRLLGGSLLITVLDSIGLTLPQCLSALSHRKGGRMTAAITFGLLADLIRARVAQSEALCELINFIGAHARAREEKDCPAVDFESDNNELRVDRSATLFRRTFDIPKVLQRLKDGLRITEVRRGHGVKNNFVVYRSPGSFESKTLRLSDEVAGIINMIQERERVSYAMDGFAHTKSTRGRMAILDLVERGVLHGQLCDHS